MKLPFISMLLIGLSMCAGCNNSSEGAGSSTAEIVGTYKGHYGGGTEVFEIHDDGTFSQIFRGGTNNGYKLTGKWVYETNMVFKGESTKISRITFKPFMIPVGMAGCVTNAKVEVGSGDWKRDPVRIEVGAWPYYVTKVQDNGTDVK